jgi:hypothetical protein
MNKYITAIFFTTLVIFASCSSGRVYVTEKPADPVYNRPPSPNPSFVWIGSGYVKRGGKSEYKPGHWASPNNSRHHWVDGYWKPKGKGWVWIPGHWN